MNVSPHFMLRPLKTKALW